MEPALINLLLCYVIDSLSHSLTQCILISFFIFFNNIQTNSFRILTSGFLRVCFLLLLLLLLYCLSSVISYFWKPQKPTSTSDLLIKCVMLHKTHNIRQKTLFLFTIFSFWFVVVFVS